MFRVEQEETIKPDNWIRLRVSDSKGRTNEVLLSGWSGGYTTGSSWRLSSNLKPDVREDEDYFYFETESGSSYKCRKNSQCLRMNTAGVYNQLKEMYTVEEVTLE